VKGYREAMPGVKAVRLDNPDIILNELPILGQDADFVVADGPGSQTETSRALLLRADMAIVPCKASMLEIRALAKATEVLRQAQDIRKGVPNAIIVLSMIGLNYRLTQDMRAAAQALNLPLASKSMILRQIYAEAPGQGAVVWQMGSRAKEAAQEVDELFRDLLPEIATKRLTAKRTTVTA
jgi:chromosome partitioning protein